MVISLTTSLINKSNSGVAGVASGPNTIAFKESASKLKGTPRSTKWGCNFSRNPVAFEPVKVTTSPSDTASNTPTPLPTNSCKAPSGSSLLATMSRTTASVKKLVYSDGLTTAGTPANRLTAIFSSMPQTGKLKAFTCTATPRRGTIRWWPTNVPFLLSRTGSPSTK